MFWWEEGFCRKCWPAGDGLLSATTTATLDDRSTTNRGVRHTRARTWFEDAAGVLDAYEIPAAHLVGVSAGGGFAQLLALDSPDRVLSLVLISTSPAMSGDRDLPPPTEEFGRFVASADVDWADTESVIEYLVGYSRMLAGGLRPFDEAAVRELVRRDIERARSFPSVRNHDLIAGDDGPSEPIASITAPTLVIHGSVDPMFPILHGEALAEGIPGARMLSLQGAGHGVDRTDWDLIAHAILEHTDRDTVTAGDPYATGKEQQCPSVTDTSPASPAGWTRASPTPRPRSTSTAASSAGSSRT